MLTYKVRILIKTLCIALISSLLIGILLWVLAWILVTPRVEAFSGDLSRVKVPVAKTAPNALKGQADGKETILQPNPWKELTPNEIKTYIIEQAKIKGVNPIKVEWIVAHESRFDPTRTGDDGNSRGLWQISKIFHPEVSDTCSFNVICSTNWSLNHILAGKISEWSTWRLRFKLYPNENPPI